MLRFLVNPHSRSGKGKIIWEKLRASLPADLAFQEFQTQYPGHGVRLAAALTEKPEDPAPVIAVMGGDGSLNEALNGFHLENHPVLCCLPTGSGNDYTRGMGLSPDPQQAVENMLHHPTVQDLDFGEARFSRDGASQGRRFLVSCGMGYDASVCRCINHSRMKRLFNAVHLGKLAYLILGLKQILLCRRTDGTLSVDGGPPAELKDIAFVSCHNLPYEGGGFRFASDAVPDDGWLNLCVVTARSRARLALVLVAAFAGSRHTRFRGVYALRCRQASLQLDKPLPLHTDGEVPGEYTGMDITCHPKGLRILR